MIFSERIWKPARNDLWLALLKRLKNIAEGIPNPMQLKLPVNSTIKQEIHWLSEVCLLNKTEQIFS